MDLNLIKKLIKIVEQSEVTEFSIQEGDLKVKISKNSHQIAHVNFQPRAEGYSSPQVMQNITPHLGETKPATQTEQVKLNQHEIKSPIVGTLYCAPAPDADPYVQVGDIISPGTVLCIVEAMKLMNEIESDVSGKIVKILVENGTPVEYNQPLFIIEKI